MKKHTLFISEADAKDAVIEVGIIREGVGGEVWNDSVFRITFFLEESGDLYVEAMEESNPDTSIGNHYPEYFTVYKDEKYPSTNTTVDGEVI